MSTHRLMVMNRDPTVLGLLNDLLEDEPGYEVVSSAPHLPTLAEIEQARPAVIIVDHDFGDPAPGWETLHLVQSTIATASIPVIVLTTTEQARPVQAFFTRTGIHVLVQPFTVEALLQAIRQATSGQPAPALLLHRD